MRIKPTIPTLLPVFASSSPSNSLLELVRIRDDSAQLENEQHCPRLLAHACSMLRPLSARRDRRLCGCSSVGAARCEGEKVPLAESSGDTRFLPSSRRAHLCIDPRQLQPRSARSCWSEGEGGGNASRALFFFFFFFALPAAARARRRRRRARQGASFT